MQKRKKILSGVSIAGLIMAGSLPLMADQQGAKTCSCGKGHSGKEDKQKAKATSADKTKVKNAPADSKEVEKSKSAK